jgi:hypothetical protein
MADDVRPDDLVRSPSGRVPKWVIDEARGIKTEPVPFRASPTPTGQPPRRKGKWRERLIIVLAIALAGGYGVYAYDNDNRTAALVGPNGKPLRLNAPPPGHEEAKQRLLEAAPTGTSSSYRFQLHQTDRVTPVTWSPCRPIHYVVRPLYAPPHGAEMIDDAFTQLSLATGLKFIDEGTTEEGPVEDRPSYQKDLYGDRWAPVLVTWATPAEVPDFGVEFAGEAGGAPAYAEDRSLTYVSGTVALDARTFAGLVQSARGRVLAKSVILHEIGHLAGLAHVNDPRQVMSPRGKAATYQPGDLAGLSLLGRGPCQPSV